MTNETKPEIKKKTEIRQVRFVTVSNAVVSFFFVLEGRVWSILVTNPLGQKNQHSRKIIFGFHGWDFFYRIDQATFSQQQKKTNPHPIYLVCFERRIQNPRIENGQ